MGVGLTGGWGPRRPVEGVGLAGWALGEDSSGWGQECGDRGHCTVEPRVGTFILKEKTQPYAWGALEREQERDVPGILGAFWKGYLLMEIKTHYFL